VLCVSNDLPFAFKRFCGAEGVQGVRCASAFRSDFGKSYGVTITDGPLQGLLSRAVVVLDGTGKVVHSQQVPEIAQEPDYAAALAALG
jgi:thiol peroxidase